VSNVAVVTGANRGIGREVADTLAGRGWTVVRGARNPGDGETRLDVTDQASVDAAFSGLDRVDVLVNNAGILEYDFEPDTLARLLAVNTVGALRVARAAIPLMRRGGRIVNVSSGAGTLSDPRAYAPPYSISKAALNALTIQLAFEVEDRGILVKAVCPGWVQTDMGGSAADRPVEDGAASVLWGVDLPDNGPTGGFFRDGQRLPW
jgi:NAD(P)-dependent dehydrogenase (short-subunit alcohol dehydrogenase family)